MGFLLFIGNQKITMLFKFVSLIPKLLMGCTKLTFVQAFAKIVYVGYALSGLMTLCSGNMRGSLQPKQKAVWGLGQERAG